MVSQEANLTADDAEPQNQEAETALLFYQGLRGIYEMHYGGELRLVENTLSLHVLFDSDPGDGFVPSICKPCSCLLRLISQIDGRIEIRLHF